MIERSNASQLPGHTTVSRKAYLSAIQGATAQHLGVPRSNISSSFTERDESMNISVAAPIPDTYLRGPRGSLIEKLGRARGDLRNFLSQLLGVEIGELDLSVTSIYYTSQGSESSGTGARAERRRVL